MTRSLVTALIAGAVLGAPAARAADSLTVASWGGTYTQKQRTSVYDPFTAAKKIAISDAVYTGGLGQIRAMVEAKNTTWDVVELGAPETINACAEGSILELDKARLTNASDFHGAGLTTCGIGAVGWSLILAYNTAATGSEPKSWTDFWDLKKYPGKRALRRQPKGTLEIALLADGVPAADLYRLLGTPAGLDRAFRKLDQIKSSVQWWEAGAQPSDWLRSGAVVMSTSFIGRILEAKAEKAPVEFQWQGAFYTIDYWAIVAGTKKVDQAYEFINYATSAKAQADFSAIQAVAPVNVKSDAMLSPDRAAIMPIGKNLEQNIAFNEQFWNENLDAVTERFNAWLSK